MIILKKVSYLIVFLLTGFLVQAQIQIDEYEMGNGINFSGPLGYEMSLSGYLQPSLELTESSNNDQVYDRFRMRRMRLRLSGVSANEKIDYRLQLDLTGSSEADGDDENSNMLLDAFVRYRPINNLAITVGQKGTPTDNLELNMSSQSLQLPERSRVTSAFSSIREFGLFADGSFKIRGTDIHLRPSVAITNGDGANVFAKDRGGFKYGGQLRILPFGLFRDFGQFREMDMARELTPKLMLGVNYSYNNGISDRRGSASGEILYLDEDGNEALPDYEKFGANLLLKYRGFTLLGEYVNAKTHVGDDIAQRVRTNGTTTDDFEIDGEQNIENYIKNRMMLGSGYNIQAGYLFPSLWSVDARYTYLDADDYSFLNNGAFYDRPRYYEVGFSRYLMRNYAAKIQASVIYVDAGELARDRNDELINGHEWIGRIMITFAF